MIQHVDRAVEQFIRREAGLPEASIDLSFDAPDRTWGAARTRPTINCFLWEIVRDPTHQATGMQQRTAASGGVERRPLQPVVQLHYLLTAWANEYRDEHQLLGSVLGAILANRVLPADLLPDALAGCKCGVALASYDKRVPGEFWSALDGRLKPGLQLEVSLPMEVFAWQPTAAPVESVAVSAEASPPPPRPTPAVVPGALRRRRAGGAIVMEGRGGEEETVASPSGSGDGRGEGA